MIPGLLSEDGHTVRLPAVVGTFYPCDVEALRRAVQAYLAAARVPELPGVRAVIAPHASYRFSGPVAGFSFKALAQLPDGYYTIYLMGPAHRWPVGGVGFSSAHAFKTVLGRVPVATDRVERLLQQGVPYYVVDEAHRLEHCLEVELPFLQSVLPSYRIVPMLFDEGADPEKIGADLAVELAEDPHSLMVVSSDLSHFHPYDQAAQIDWAFLDALAACDRTSVGRGEACGLIPICCLMVVAAILAWMPHVLYYKNSGDAGGPRSDVVGYAAVAYTG
jgi:MEMO1 family protein